MIKFVEYSDIINNVIKLKDKKDTKSIIEIPFIANLTCDLYLHDCNKTNHYKLFRGNKGIIKMSIEGILKEGLKNKNKYLKFYNEIQDENKVKEQVKDKKEETVNNSDTKNNVKAQKKVKQTNKDENKIKEQVKDKKEETVNNSDTKNNVKAQKKVKQTNKNENKDIANNNN